MENTETVKNTIKTKDCLHEWVPVENDKIRFRCAKCGFVQFHYSSKKPLNVADCKHDRCEVDNKFINGIPYYYCLDCYMSNPFDKFKNVKVVKVNNPGPYIPVEYQTRANECEHEYYGPWESTNDYSKYTYHCKKCDMQISYSTMLKNSDGCNHNFTFNLSGGISCLVCEVCGFIYTMKGPKSNFT